MISYIVTHPDGTSVSFFKEDIIEMQRFETVGKPYTKITLVDDRIVVCQETPEDINGMVNDE